MFHDLIRELSTMPSNRLIFISVVAIVCLFIVMTFIESIFKLFVDFLLRIFRKKDKSNGTEVDKH